MRIKFLQCNAFHFRISRYQSVQIIGLQPCQRIGIFFTDIKERVIQIIGVMFTVVFSVLGKHQNSPCLFLREIHLLRILLFQIRSDGLQQLFSLFLCQVQLISAAAEPIRQIYRAVLIGRVSPDRFIPCFQLSLQQLTPCRLSAPGILQSKQLLQFFHRRSVVIPDMFLSFLIRIRKHNVIRHHCIFKISFTLTQHIDIK